MTEKCTIVTTKSLNIKVDRDVVAARQEGRQMARELGFGVADQTRLATAISELVRNVIKYAGEGDCHIWDESDQSMIKIRVIVEDHGPGISDVEAALEDSFSTSGSLGAGLPGTRRLMQEFNIHSEPGYTKITIAMARKRP